MENIETTPFQENKPLVNGEIGAYLIETAKWGKFLAIMGYITIGLLMLGGLIAMVVFSSMDNLIYTKIPLSAMGAIYIIIGVVYFFPVNYLYKFSQNIRKGVVFNEEYTLTMGFQNLKSLFKFIGIVTIVALAIYVLIIVVMVPAIMLMA